MNPPQPTEPEEIEALREGFQKPESKLSELLPCPFCGGEAEIVRHGTPRQSAQVGCTNCHCNLESNEIGAGKLWNTRPAVKLPEKPSELVVSEPNVPVTFKAIGEFQVMICEDGDIAIYMAPQRGRMAVYPGASNAVRISRQMPDKRLVQAALEKGGL